MNSAMPSMALLKRELIAQLRRVRSWVCLLVLMVFLVWTALVSWPNSETITWSRMPSVTQGLLNWIAMLLLTGSALFIPGVAATSIVVEKERRHWDMLSMTMLRPLGIMAGKSASAVGIYLLYVVAAFPVLSIVFFLIGVDWVQLTLSFLLVMLSSVSFAVVGVACSAYFKRTATAIAASYFGMTCIMGLPLLLVILFIAVLGLGGYINSLPFNEEMLLILSPYTTLLFITQNVGRMPNLPELFFACHAVYQGLIIVVAALWGGRSVRRALRPRPAGGFLRRRQRDSGRPRKRLRDRFRRRRKPRPPIRDGSNPIFAREVYWSLVGSRRIYVLAACLFAGMALVLVSGTGETEAIYTSLIVHGVMICCFVPTVLAGAFTREYEHQCMDMLRMTTTRSGAIVRGKFLAGLRLVVLLSLSSVVGNVAVFVRVYDRADRLWTLALGHGTIFICALLAGSLALAASILSKRTSTAIVTSFVFVLLFFFGGYIVMALLWETIDWRGQASRESLQFAAIFSSPVIGYFAAGATSRFKPDFPLYWLANSIEFTIVSFLVYVSSGAFFARRRMRER